MEIFCHHHGSFLSSSWRFSVIIMDVFCHHHGGFLSNHGCFLSSSWRFSVIIMDVSVIIMEVFCHQLGSFLSSPWKWLSIMLNFLNVDSRLSCTPWIQVNKSFQKTPGAWLYDFLQHCGVKTLTAESERKTFWGLWLLLKEHVNKFNIYE